MPKKRSGEKKKTLWRKRQYLTNIRHLSRLMSVLHMLEKQWLAFKCPLTDLALGCKKKHNLDMHLDVRAQP